MRSCHAIHTSPSSLCLPVRRKSSFRCLRLYRGKTTCQDDVEFVCSFRCIKLPLLLILPHPLLSFLSVVSSLQFEIAHLDVGNDVRRSSSATPTSSSSSLSYISCLSLSSFANFLTKHRQVSVHFNRFTVFVRTRQPEQLRLLAEVLGRIEVSQNLR